MKNWKNMLSATSAMLVLTLTGVQAADLTAPMEPVTVATSGGFYFGSVNSLTFLDNTNFDFGGDLFSVNTDYDVGYYSAVRAGYKFDQMSFVTPRVELEIGYGTSSVDYHSVNGSRSASIDSYGDANTIQGYVNGYLDIPLSGDAGILSAVTPYIGGGVGFMNLELQRQGVSGVGTQIDDDDTQFAYHADAGVGIDIQKLGLFSNMSLLDNTTLDIGYRYTGANDFNLKARDGTSSSTDFSSHAIVVGFRKQF